MKPPVYIALFLVLIPFQASLLEPLSIAGIKPDLPLAMLYIIGLLTSPREATLVGIGTGLLLDIASASTLGLMGISRGLIGLSASLLGTRVLDLSSPSNGFFLAAFCLVEGICIALFLQLFYGSMPFFSLVAGNVLPKAIYTGLLGVVLLQLITRKNVLPALKRRTTQKEL
jgi:rod shape-determining protein MreD